jgi:hypothetical protein
MAFQLTTHGSVTLVTLDAPPANALDHAFLRELHALLPELAAARAVVVTGSGRFFSAGLDLIFFHPLAAPTACHPEKGVVSFPVGNDGGDLGGRTVATAARLTCDDRDEPGRQFSQLPLVGTDFPEVALAADVQAWGRHHVATVTADIEPLETSDGCAALDRDGRVTEVAMVTVAGARRNCNR